MLVNYISIFISSFILVFLSIRKIIYVSHKKHLFDEPSEDRKVHITRTPNLGGIAIFSASMFISFLFLPGADILKLKYLIISATVIFIVGLVDDLVGVNPIKKLLPQVGVALITTMLGNFRFTNFHGFLGLTEMPFAISIFVSVLFILLLINAFNLIDGINCLAGGLSLLVCLIFAYFFWQIQETGFMLMAIALCGCLVGFLFYNRTPAKIFMGDTGSLFLGYVVSVFAIHFIELNNTELVQRTGPEFYSAPAIVFGLLIIPIFDTLRVFSLRIAKGKSPFTADRNHFHHRLLDLKLSHLQATGILLLITAISSSIVFVLQSLRNESLLVIITVFILSCNWIVGFLLARKKMNKTQKNNYPKQVITWEKFLYKKEAKANNKTAATFTDEMQKWLN